MHELVKTYRFVIVALTAAAILASGWVRSAYVTDSVYLRLGDYRIEFISYRGTIYWFAKDILYYWPELFEISYMRSFIDLNLSSRLITEKYHAYGEAKTNAYQDSVWPMPYWTLIAPLILFVVWRLSRIRLAARPRRPTPYHEAGEAPSRMAI